MDEQFTSVKTDRKLDNETPVYVNNDQIGTSHAALTAAALASSSFAGRLWWRY